MRRKISISMYSHRKMTGILEDLDHPILYRKEREKKLGRFERWQK